MSKNPPQPTPDYPIYPPRIHTSKTNSHATEPNLLTKPQPVVTRGVAVLLVAALLIAGVCFLLARYSGE